MECLICYTADAKYKIQCDSKVPHQLCFSCERQWRLKSKPTPKGRILTCPFCRTEEKEPGCRSRTSYEAELALLYAELYKIDKTDKLKWCANRGIACLSSTKTSRTCSYPGECTAKVCPTCIMCISHF